MQIKSKVVFAITDKYINPHAGLRVQLELLQPGCEEALVKRLLGSLVDCQMQEQPHNIYNTRPQSPSIHYRNNRDKLSNNTPSDNRVVICSPEIDCEKLKHTDFGLSSRYASEHTAEKLQEPNYKNAISSVMVAFSFTEFSGDDIALLFNRWFGLPLQAKPALEYTAHRNLTSLNSLTDLEKYITKVEFLPFLQNGKQGKTLEGSELSAVFSNSEKPVKNSPREFSLRPQVNWFDSITDAQAAEKALFHAFRGEKPYALMTDEQRLSLVTRYPAAAAEVLKFKGIEPVAEEREKCTMM